MKTNILLLNAGRRASLLKDFKQSLDGECNLIATDNWSVAPALFYADKYYLTPKVTDSNYIEQILDICKKENINGLTTLIDPEISILAKNKDIFVQKGILPLVPSYKTAELCFNKFKMYEYLKANDIPTVLTYNDLDSFKTGYENKKITFPVFIKPITGSGSVGAQEVDNYEQLENLIANNKFNYIIQEYMDCEDIDADVYTDTISGEIISIFAKKKIEKRIGGASKTISFKDEKLFDFIKKINKIFEFSGPIDVDFFRKDGEYYLNEINPRLGGAYLHAYGAGVDFPRFIQNNLLGITNKPNIGNYKEDVLMLMYDSVVIVDKKDLRKSYID